MYLAYDRLSIEFELTPLEAALNTIAFSLPWKLLITFDI